MFDPDTPPFYPGEVVVGIVRKLRHHEAVLDVRGWRMPLEARLMSWNRVRSVSLDLELGQRLEVMVLTPETHVRLHACDRPSVMGKVHGYFISRLPLLENPWPALAETYPDGSEIEVELVRYERKGYAIVRIADSVLSEMPMIGLERHAGRNQLLPVRPLPGDMIRVCVRGNLSGHFWLEPRLGLRRESAP